MIIVVEGPRSSGKTTLVRTLGAVFGDRSRIIKFNRTMNPPLSMTQFLARNYLALVDSRTVAIIDRFHMTEFVMRTLDGKVQNAQLVQTTGMIDVMLKEMGAIIYVLEAKQDVRRKRTSSRGDADHRKPEWESLDTSDAVWRLASTLFSRADVRIKKTNTLQEMDAIVIDAITAFKKQTSLIDFKASRGPIQTEEVES